MSFQNNPTTSSSNAAQQFTPEQLQIGIPCLTKDGDKIFVKNELLLQSDLYSAMAKDLFLGFPDAKLDGFEFPVKNIPTGVFKLIVEWLKEHEGKPLPVERKWIKYSQFEEGFFQKLSVDELGHVLFAANFLKIKSLHLCGCQALAKLIKDNYKSPEQLRELLGLEDDMTEEEKAQARAQNAWLHLTG